MRRYAALAVLAAMGCQSPSAPPDTPPAIDSAVVDALRPDALRPDATMARSRPEARALLVGVDTYADPSLSPLPGAANDVAAMRAMLTGTFDFEPARVRSLIGAEATGQNITDAFRAHLIAPARPGMVAVFHFSGHGRRVFDRSGDEPDGWDEAIVPYDAGPRPGGLLDDAFAPLLKDLTARGASAVLIFDSCYAGSPVRGGAAVRSAPAIGGTRGAATEAVAARGDLFEDAAGGFVVITATRSGQKAHELRDPRTGMSFGALTWALTRAAAAAPPGTTWRTLMADVRHTVGLYLPRQSPSAHGAHVDRQLFDLVDRPPPSRSLAVDASDGLRLRGGALHGVRVGDRYALYGPTDDPTRADLPLATVVDVEATTARLSGVDHAPRGARAIERTRALDPEPVLITLGGRGPLDVVKQHLLDAGFRVGPNGAVRVVVADATARLTATDGTPWGDAVDLGRAGGLDAVGAVRAWVRWRRLVELQGGAEPDVRLTLSGAQEGRARPGDAIRLTIDNRGGARWYASLFVLGDDGAIGSLWPPDIDPFIEGGSALTIPPDGQPLVVTLPPGRRRSVDVIKLILTRRPADFGALTTRDAAKGSGHPLVDWLAGAPDRGEGADTRLPRADWAVRTLRVETCADAGCAP